MPDLLHVGCGQKRINQTTPGFATGQWSEIRLDIDENVNPDIIGTMTDMSAVRSESVDAVFSSHNIEHLYAHEVPVALGEFRRVLKEDGFVVITCPDLAAVAALIADGLVKPAYVSPAGPIAPIDILYGHRASIERGNHFMAHRCGFTEEVLRGTLAQSGFRSVGTARKPGQFALWAVASKSARSEAEMRELAQRYFG